MQEEHLKMTSNEEYIRRNKVVIIDDDKNTRLHYAAALDNVAEIEKIVATKQKLDPENYLGWTPLMMAVRNANPDAINLLLKHGADATKKNKFGMNVFLISVTCGHLEIVDQILNHLLCGGISRRSLQKTFSPVALAILFGQAHIFKYLLERSFDPNATTPLTGITPAMFAAAVGHNKAIKKLLQHNADIKMKNHLGKTASDILQSRQNRIDIEAAPNKQKPRHLPVIIISPNTPNSPHLQLTPYPGTNFEHSRKSSNVRTPNMCCTPNLTPITPHLMPQSFFGPNFNPNQYLSPAFLSNTFLNTTISPSSAFLSPVFPQMMCHPNYV